MKLLMKHYSIHLLALIRRSILHSTYFHATQQLFLFMDLSLKAPCTCAISCINWILQYVMQGIICSTYLVEGKTRNRAIILSILACAICNAPIKGNLLCWSRRHLYNTALSILGPQGLSAHQVNC